MKSLKLAFAILLIGTAAAAANKTILGAELEARVVGAIEQKYQENTDVMDGIRNNWFDISCQDMGNSKIDCVYGMATFTRCEDAGMDEEQFTTATALIPVTIVNGQIEVSDLVLSCSN